jgi:HSP20 family protein
MTLRDLIPWNRDREPIAERELEFPLKRLHWGINSLFDDFIENFDLPVPSEGDVLTPRIDVSETDKEVTVSAEMPGLDENDIDISLEQNSLVISGQKQTEKKSEEKRYSQVERTYSSFFRRIPLPHEVDAKKVKATYKKGILTVKLPISAHTPRKNKRIEIH